MMHHIAFMLGTIGAVLACAVLAVVLETKQRGAEK